MKTRIFVSTVAFGLVCMMGLSGTAQAKTVSVNFYYGGTGAALGAGDVAGVVGVANWNNVDGNAGPAAGGGGKQTTLLNLNDDTGAASGVDLRAHYSGPNGGEAVGGATPDDVMMSGGVRASIIGHAPDPSDGQFELTGLAAAFPLGYDIYLYLGEGHPNMGSNGQIRVTTSGYTDANGTDLPAGGTDYGYWTSTAAVTYPPFDPTAATNDPGNYRLISGLSGDTQVLTVDAQGGQNNGQGGFFVTATVLGLQIVGPQDTGGGAAATPEPSSVALAAIGLAGIGFFSRRRKRSRA